MDHRLHKRLETAELTEGTLRGAVVYGADDYEIGKVAHLHGNGPAMQIIVDVGGFPGLGSKMVALRTSQLHFMREDAGAVHAITAWTKDQVEALPEHHH